MRYENSTCELILVYVGSSKGYKNALGQFNRSSIMAAVNPPGHGDLSVNVHLNIAEGPIAQ